MHVQRSHPLLSRGIAVFATVAVVLAMLPALLATRAAAAPAAAPAAVTAVAGVTATYTWQCDPDKPGYGTSNPAAQPVRGEVGDRYVLKIEGAFCRSWDYHIRGDATQLVVQPPLPVATSRDRLPFIADGTTYVVDVVKVTGAPGWVALPFFTSGGGTMADFELLIDNPVPPAPVITSATRVGPNIVIEFTQEQSKFPITGYQYIFSYDDWSLRGLDNWAVVPGGQVTSPLVIPALFSAAQLHTIKLRAVNSAGPGAFTTGMAPATLVYAGRPTNERAEPGDGQVLYSWDPSPPGSAPVKEYQVEVYTINSRGRSVLFRTFRTSSTSALVTGLTNGAKYTFYSTPYDVDGERGRDSLGTSAVPNRAPVVTDICHLGPDGLERITITFDPVNGDAHYRHAGDIIPPVAGRAGVNWDDSGSVIFDNNCVEVPPADTDEDGIIDLEDVDDDGDGLADVIDSDDDGDGTSDAQDANHSLKTDVDGDGVPNAYDPDDDGDGIQDAVDTDSDGDQVDDSFDEDVALPVDTDRDGTPDAVDSDDDGDCIADARDSDRDGDGIRDSRDSDLDGDGLPNRIDGDDDGDGLADSIDPDANGDASIDVIDALEGGSTSTRAGLEPRARQCEVSDAGDVDLDGDGQPNAVDSDDDGDGVRDAVDEDVDDDGVPNEEDANQGGSGIVDTEVAVDDNADTDGDGVANAADRDDDGDGVRDAVDDDVDGDGIPNEEDADADGDGIVNTEDRDSTEVMDPAQIDSDGDGVPNTRDRDDDGDQVRDVRDGDADGDGQPETVVQTLADAEQLPRALPSNGTVTLIDKNGRTNARQRVQVTVACTEDAAALRSRPAGDVVGSALRSCEVRQSGGKVVLRVKAAAPTRVTVRVTAPATGDHLRMEMVRSYRIG